MSQAWQVCVVVSRVRLIASIKIAPASARLYNLRRALDRKGPMPKIDVENAPTRFGTGYTPPFNARCEDA